MHEKPTVIMPDTFPDLESYKEKILETVNLQRDAAKEAHDFKCYKVSY